MNEQTQHNDTSPPDKDKFLNRLRNATPAIMKDNAPRIVGGLKIAGSSMMVLMSKNWFFRIAGLHFIAANAVMAAFGGKKTEAEKEKLRQEDSGVVKTGIAGHIKKVLQPHKYPIEAAAAISSFGSLFWTAAGLKDSIENNQPLEGRLISGLTSLGADVNASITKENIGSVLENPHSKTNPKYYITKLKNQPVLVSSSLNVICDLASIGTGATKLITGKSAAMKREGLSNLAAGTFLLSANIYQAIFVNKNDYNLEQSAEELEKQASKVSVMAATNEITLEKNTGSTAFKATTKHLSTAGKPWAQQLEDQPLQTVGLGH